MAECQICKRNRTGLKFETAHINICTDCVNDLNDWSEPAYSAQGRIGDLLRTGMARRNPNYTEEQYRRALPGWFNRLLANKRNNSQDFRVVRAARRGLLRETGVHTWEYPADWKERAQRIKERDKHCCQFCGSNSQLDVHHIVYLSNWGTNQQSNLVTLCRPCHEAEHGREFDFGEPDEPSNPSPIQPKRGQTRKAKSPPKPEASTPFESSTLDEARHDYRQPRPRRPTTASPISPPLPSTDLWCPKCDTSLTAKLTTAVLESQKVRCPVCKTIFTASEGLERRIIRPASPSRPTPKTAAPEARPAPAPAQSEATALTESCINSADDEVAPTIRTPRFEQSPNPVKTNDGILRWDIAVFALIGLALLFLAIVTGERNTNAEKILPAPEKPIEVQVQETMSEALRTYPYLTTEQGLEATREIISVRNQLLTQGVPPVTALQQAISQVAPEHDPRQAKP